MKDKIDCVNTQWGMMVGIGQKKGGEVTHMECINQFFANILGICAVTYKHHYRHRGVLYTTLCDRVRQ